jgi:hypothetical protein
MTVPSDRYRLIERHSEGPISTWSAFDETLGRPVTIRLANLGEEAGQRLRLQARALARTEHPSLLRVLDTDADSDTFALVTEVMPTVTVAEEVAAGGPLPPRDAVLLALEIGEALNTLHTAGFSHGGVTIDNIGRRDNGHAVILDGPPTDDAVIIPATPSDDLRSLAAVTHHLLVGQPPLTSPSGQHDLHPEIPAALTTSIRAALDPSVDGDMPSYLQSLRDKIPILPSHRPIGEESATSFFASERAWFAPVAILMVTVGLLLVAGIILSQTRTASEDIAVGKDVLGVPVPQSTSSAPAVSTVETRPPSPSRALQIIGLVDFDPEGDDRTENPERLALVNDGVPEDGWYTARYATNDFGNLKSGVGLILNLGPPQYVSRLVIGSPSLGWGVKVFASTDQVGQLIDWGEPVVILDDINGNATLEFPDVEASTILIWISDLGRELSAGGHRVTITTIDVEGRPLFG